jgi:cyclophilin family peptidyl-prolyl cis-trans isomerase
MRVTVTTTAGPLVMQFMPHVAPLFVAHFIGLAERGFYEGIPFYRIVSRFMVQSGHNSHRLESSPKHPWPVTCPDEWTGAEVVHQKGFCNVANAGRNTQASEWCVFDGPAMWLTGKHTIFAVLIDGYDTLAAIASTPVMSTPTHFNGEKSKPTEADAVVVTKVDVDRAHFADDTTYQLVIRTNWGVMRASLFHEAAPKTVAHIVSLMTKYPTFYHKNPFHRVVNNYLLQGGKTPAALSAVNTVDLPMCPKETTHLKHVRGSLASVANTQGQLCVFARESQALDGAASDTVFGVVTHGFAVLDELLRRPTKESDTFRNGDAARTAERSTPIEQVTILDMELVPMRGDAFTRAYLDEGGGSDGK